MTLDERIAAALAQQDAWKHNPDGLRAILADCRTTLASPAEALRLATEALLLQRRDLAPTRAAPHPEYDGQEWAAEPGYKGTDAWQANVAALAALNGQGAPAERLYTETQVREAIQQGFAYAGGPKSFSSKLEDAILAAITKERPETAARKAKR